MKMDMASNQCASGRINPRVDQDKSLAIEKRRRAFLKQQHIEILNNEIAALEEEADNLERRCGDNKPLRGMITISVAFGVPSGKICWVKPHTVTDAESALLQSCLEKTLKRRSFRRAMFLGFGWPKIERQERLEDGQA